MILDVSVDRFDALASGRSQAGFDEVAADARQMADGLNDLGDALDALADASFVEAGTDLRRDQGKAIGRTNRRVDRRARQLLLDAFV